MALIPINNPIQDSLDNNDIVQMPRPYLGYSGLAHPCKRYLWLGFRWTFKKVITQRLKRIFERGDLEEARIIRDLKAIGCEVYRVDEEGNHVEIFGTIGEEQEEIIGLASHIKGHIDGRILGLPGAEKTEHLAEFKTMKSSKWKELYKAGANQEAIKKVFPVYYGQLNSYMGKLKIDRAFFVATNKDTEERHYIRVHFDKDEFEHLESVGMDILTSTIPPKRIGNATWFECKWCDAKAVCQSDAMPLKNCRSCVRGCIEDEGKWTCEMNGKELSLKDQEKGCSRWDMIPEIKDILLKVNKA